jgi:hypothetical protein
MRYDELIERAERRMFHLYRQLDKTHFTTAQVREFLGPENGSPLLSYSGVDGLGWIEAADSK